MSSIKIFVIFTVRTFNFSVMPWGVWFYEFVLYVTLFERTLKQCGRRILSITKTLGELLSVVCLNALHLKRKRLEHIFEKDSR